jgi:hypothetical protein
MIKKIKFRNQIYKFKMKMILLRIILFMINKIKKFKTKKLNFLQILMINNFKIHIKILIKMIIKQKIKKYYNN